MEGQSEGKHGDEVAEIEDGETVLGGTPIPPATAGGETPEASVMPVADVMALLQAMREEQLDTLKRIADGVQQLQSQVMVLGESASASEGNTSMVLSRLAALEVRLGATPVPMNPHDRTATPPYQIQPQLQQDARAGGLVGGGALGTGSVARIPAFAATAQAGPSPPMAGKVPLPPPAAVAEPGRAPTWQGRAEPEPPRTHFMRTASPHARPSPATSKPLPPAGATQAAARGVDAGGFEGGGRGEDDAKASKEAARKEAKRLAFMEDRARIQARISAKKGGGKEPAGAKPAPAPTSAAPPAEKPGVVETQPLFDAPSTRPPAAGRSSPFATAIEGGGLFSNSPSFLDGKDGGDRARAGAEEDEAAAWLEREKAQREQREKARREEEERVERQRAEAKRLMEEEQARKVREAEEARAREKARREAEAKKQAKTRVLMSSLFDKGDEDDGNSLFGGLGGAALPVFTDESNDHSGFDHSGSGTDQAAKIPVAPASSVSTAASPPISSGGGLFGGLEEPTAASRGGKPGSPFVDQFSSPMGEEPSARKDLGAVVVEADSSGLFDSLPPPSQASKNPTGSSSMAAATNGGATDEMDDFLSTLETAGASAPSGGGTSAPTAVRDSIFGDDEFAGGGSDDGLFSSLPAVESNRGAAGRGAAAAPSGAGTSLFDRAEFSIESGDDEGGNVFGGAVGGVGSAKRGGGENFGTSFMSAMEDADLSLSGDGGKSRGGEGGDGEGMVEVTF